MFHSFLLSLCSNTLTLESIFEYIHQKLIKNMLILKFHPRMKCLHVFFSFFHPGMKSHPCLSSGDEISSRQKRVNSKRHFTIDRDDFIPGQVSSWDEISHVNTLQKIFFWCTYLNYMHHGNWPYIYILFVLLFFCFSHMNRSSDYLFW